MIIGCDMIIGVTPLPKSTIVFVKPICSTIALPTPDIVDKKMS